MVESAYKVRMFAKGLMTYIYANIRACLLRTDRRVRPLDAFGLNTSLHVTVAVTDRRRGRTLNALV